MQTITQLTPAETYLLTQGSSVLLKDLLKYTFIDLLFKRVLNIMKPTNRYKTLSANNICIGSQFTTYSPRKHELAFLEIFNKSRDLNIMFYQLVKIAYQYANSKHKFVFKHLFNTPYISKSLEISPLKNLFFNIQLTEEGVLLKHTITSELNELEKNFPKLIRNNPQESKAILDKIKGNIFLLKNFDFELLKEIEPALKKPIEDIEDKDFDCFYFDSYNTFSTIFDNDFERAEAEENPVKKKPQSYRSTHRSSYHQRGSFWGSVWEGLWDSIWNSDGDGDWGDGGCGGCGGCG